MMLNTRGRVIDYDREMERILYAIGDIRHGVKKNVAVIGEPFSGKTTMLEDAVRRSGQEARVIRLKSIALEAPDLRAEEKTLVIDDCQYLYLRSIGGFDVLESFLNATVTSDKLFVTAWNLHSWDYLKETYMIPDYFPVTVVLPPLDEDHIGSLIRSRFNVQEDIEDAIKEVAKLSRGNPGVALSLWARAYKDGHFDQKGLSVPEFDLDMDSDTSFVLSSILMMKSLSHEDVRSIVGGQAGVYRILGVLKRRDLILESSGRYHINPVALHAIRKSLDRSRQVW